MTPRERVDAFLADFERAHTTMVEGQPDDVDFDRWADMVEEDTDDGDLDRWSKLVGPLNARHFVGEAGLELSNSFSSTLEHGREVEAVTSERIDGDHAVIETETSDGVKQYYEYELTCVGADWRIRRLATYFEPPDAAFIAPEERASWLEPAPAGELRAVAGNVSVNGDRLFEDGREVALGEDRVALKVRDVGELVLTSGVLVVGDLGYGTHSLQPLVARVPPGSYPVQAAVAGRVNCALRVCLSDAEVDSWRCADGPGGGHVMGVDAGNLAVIDASSVVGVLARTKERAFDAWARGPSGPKADLLSLCSEHDAVIAESGSGDGAYPVYWGLSEDGRPAVLLLDFLVLAQPITTTLQVAVANGLTSPELQEHGLTLSLQPEGKRLSLVVEGDVPDSLKLIGANGDEVADGSRSVTTGYEDDRTTFTWSYPIARDKVDRVRLTLSSGYRND
jgi:Protein of unknown function (DUF4241)